MEFDDFMKRSDLKYKLDPRRFRILRLDEVPEFSESVFSITKDRNEVTAVSSGRVNGTIISEEKYFRLVTFDLTLPFNLTGFISRMTGILADAKVPVFVISSYSTDHFLINERFLAGAMKAFEERGIHRS